MEGVDKIKFEDVHQIYPNFFADFNLNGMVLIIERNAIDGVEIVAIVEVNVDAVHDHDHLFVHGWATFLGINDECAIKSFGNMAR